MADSNAISGSGSYGLYLNISTSYTGSVVGTRNNISENLGYGVYTGFNGPMSFTLGRFFENGNHSVYSTYAFDATQNWWGDPAGSVLGPVDTSSSLASDPTDVPALAPAAASGMSFSETAATMEKSPEDRRAAIHERVRRAREEHLARKGRRK